MAHYGALPLAAFMVKLGSVFGSGGGSGFYRMKLRIVCYGFLGCFLRGHGLSLPVRHGVNCTGYCSTITISISLPCVGVSVRCKV